jgi:AAA family ATP:ADP antiporter
MERPQVTRVLALCGLAFAVLASYEVARSAVESPFLTAHTEKALPQVWLLVAAGAAVAVGVYNRFAARTPLLRLFGACTFVSCALLALLQGARALEVPGAHYALYVWKDVYIVVVLEAFWSFANTVFPIRSARWVYGWFCAAGSLGSAAGAEIVKRAAPAWGTASALWLVIPLLGLAWAGAALMRAPPATAEAKAPANAAWREGARLLRESPYLGRMLLVIVAVQLVVTLVDYEYNALLRTEYPDEAARTAASAGVYQAISFGALALQVLTGPILRIAGVAGTLVGIPLLIAVTVAGLALTPAFAIAAAAKVAGKTFDYSLFRAAKEILYIPLSYAEKTQGKALVDMLSYRVAKGGASLLLQGLIALGALAAVSWLALGWVAVWLALTVGLVRRWRLRVEARGAERDAA